MLLSYQLEIIINHFEYSFIASKVINLSAERLIIYRLKD